MGSTVEASSLAMGKQQMSYPQQRSNSGNNNYQRRETKEEKSNKWYRTSSYSTVKVKEMVMLMIAGCISLLSWRTWLPSPPLLTRDRIRPSEDGAAKKASLKSLKKKSAKATKKLPTIDWKKMTEKTKSNTVPIVPRREVSQTFLDAREYLRAKRQERERIELSNTASTPVMTDPTFNQSSHHQTHHSGQYRTPTPKVKQQPHCMEEVGPQQLPLQQLEGVPPFQQLNNKFHRDCWTAPVPKKCSWVLKKILKCRNVVNSVGGWSRLQHGAKMSLKRCSSLRPMEQYHQNRVRCLWCRTLVLRVFLHDAGYFLVHFASTDDRAEELPKVVQIEDPNGLVFYQKVTYDWLPPFCEKCQLVGHVSPENQAQTKTSKR
uniref:Uncharacterized protein n=1 Tax=Chenopodium quinoa TaxID=63459 RepID=A0A803N130_CHEQI